MGILDTIIDKNRDNLTRDFSPIQIVHSILDKLKERDKHILSKRYGLSGFEEQTLEKIGKELQLTRERVRQIEKALLKQLKDEYSDSQDLNKAKNLVQDLISDHGGLMAEADLLEKLGTEAIEEANAVKFLLLLVGELESIRNHAHIKDAWKAVHFDIGLFNSLLAVARQVLESEKKPHKPEQFLKAFKETSFYREHETRLSDKTILNFLDAAKHIDKNAYSEYGLSHWREISPKDVGDKAYLVLKHHGKPEHFAKITELINTNYPDGRKAHKETVHNELIKDERFVLVGRGIYGLAEWGYKKGVVADVITEVIKNAGKPLSRKEIVEEVSKQRVVQRNTILVALSNKKKFRKISKDLYDTAS